MLWSYDIAVLFMGPLWADIFEYIHYPYDTHFEFIECDLEKELAAPQLRNIWNVP